MKSRYEALGIGALAAALAVTGDAVAQDQPTRLEQRIERSEKSPASEKFAVLIASSADLREAQTAAVPILENAYATLIGSMGYKPENVYVLLSGGDSTSFPVDGLATRETIGPLGIHLQERLGPEDDLYVHVTGHGQILKTKDEVEIEGKKGRKKVKRKWVKHFTIGDDHIDSRDFGKLFGDIPGKAVMLFDTCYGGHFARASARSTNVTVTQASKGSAWGADFSNAWYDGIRSCAADRNQDGRVTVDEATAHATDVMRADGTWNLFYKLGWMKPAMYDQGGKANSTILSHCP